VPDPNPSLVGTPYLIESDSVSMRKFEQLQLRSFEYRQRAYRENDRIRSEASEVLEPYLRATRSDLVAESNVIEGYDWTADEVREVLLKSREIVDGPVRNLMASVRSDKRVYEVLGLYKAHAIAEEWTSTERAPAAHEIRELHGLIMGDVELGGRYKLYPNEIAGSDLRTAAPFDVARVMLQLADWWQRGTDDPVLTATVVHAWLAHIHPFEDGNGRLARVLANLELSRNGYPPLIIRAQSDRGEYYTALASSDEGNLLPLYELFVKAMRRQIRLMSSPNYVRDLISNQFLSSDAERYRMWSSTFDLFISVLRSAFEDRGSVISLQGTPTLSSFNLLSRFDSDGNGWFATVGQPFSAEWLLWFGFRSHELRDLTENDFPFPSLFISRRDRTEGAAHPFTRHFERDSVTSELPEEITISPARNSPVCFRWGFSENWMTFERAAGRLASILTA